MNSNRYILGLLFSGFFLLNVFHSKAQFDLLPPQTNIVLERAWPEYQAQEESFSIRSFEDTLNLPFVDDFSYPGPYPDPAKWNDNQVFVNPTLAVDPKTIGVATFDGLGPDGTPWGGGYGYSDTLTSKWLNLGSYNAGSNVYISFFYQAKGLGDRPEAHDSLFLEFKLEDETWERVWEIPGFQISDPSNMLLPFQLVSIHINQAKWLYNGFQFRIRNKSHNSGLVDLWHVDYVRVTQGEIPSETFQDIAIIDPIRPVLKPYTSMPFRHFNANRGQYLRSEHPLRVFNHTNQAQPAGLAVFDIHNMDGSQIYSTVILDNLGENNLVNNEFIQYDNVLTGATEVADMHEAMGMFTLPDGAETGYIQHRMFISPSNQDPNIAAAFRNDTVKNHIVFDEYFAYDDGSAESNIAAQNTGTQIAVGFRTEVGDTLRAFQMHFQRIGPNITNELFNFQVWLDTLDGDPVYQDIFYRPIYVDSFNGFSTFTIDSPHLYIPPGKFYIGWQAATGTPIPIGFDRSNPEAVEFIKYRTGGAWLDFPLAGAIMFRPVLGNTIPITTSVSDIAPQQEHFSVFPNPARNEVFFEFESDLQVPFVVAFFDAHGRLVARENYTGGPMNVEHLGQGLYFVRILADGRTFATAKLIKL